MATAYGLPSNASLNGKIIFNLERSDLTIPNFNLDLTFYVDFR